MIHPIPRTHSCPDLVPDLDIKDPVYIFMMMNARKICDVCRTVLPIRWDGKNKPTFCSIKCRAIWLSG